MMYLAVAFAISTGIFVGLYAHQKAKMKKFTDNEKLITSYLSIHDQLQHTATATLTVEKVDTANLFVWKNQ